MDIPAVLISQYLASLEMLEQAIVNCPESLWNAGARRTSPGPPPTMPSSSRTTTWQTPRKPSPPGTNTRPTMTTSSGRRPRNLFDKDTILEYLAFCRREVRERVPRLNLDAPAGFHRGKRSGLELQIYSIRHIMQHTGELMDRLAGEAEEIEWVGSVRD